MSEDAVAVVVTPAARVVRRQVGPQAWLVLEELVARTGHDCQCNYADVSLAELVESLQLSSDVIPSALRRLINARLVERREQRTPQGAASFPSPKMRSIIRAIVRFRAVSDVVGSTFVHVAPGGGGMKWVTGTSKGRSPTNLSRSSITC